MKSALEMLLGSENGYVQSLHALQNTNFTVVFENWRPDIDL